MQREVVESMTLVLALLGVGVVVGAAAQRVTGMGFALLMAPFFALFFGPYEGILLMNVGGLVSSSLVLYTVWRDVDWQRFSLLLLGAIPGGVLGALVATRLDSATLQIIVGLVLIAGLTASLAIAPRATSSSPVIGALLAGSVSGLTNATAGIGGPPIGIYAVSTGWKQHYLAATLQPLFIALSASALLVKSLLSGAAPALDWWIYPSMVALIVAGLGVGSALKTHVNEVAARRAVVVFCYVGAISAVIDGVWVVSQQ
jgi:hypothetical protein